MSFSMRLLGEHNVHPLISTTPKPSNFVDSLWRVAKDGIALAVDFYMKQRLNHFTPQMLDDYCRTLDETSGNGVRSSLCNAIAAYGTDIILYRTKHPDSPFFNLGPGEKQHSDDWLIFCQIAYKIASVKEQHLEEIIATLLAKAFKNLTDSITRSEERTPNLSTIIACDIIKSLTFHSKKVSEVLAKGGKKFTEKEGLHPAMPIEGIASDDAYELRQKNFFIPLSSHIMWTGLPNGYQGLEFPNDRIPLLGNLAETVWKQLEREFFPQDIFTSIYRSLLTPLFLNTALLSLLDSKSKPSIEASPIQNDDLQKDLTASCEELIKVLGKLFPNTLAAKIVEYPSIVSWAGKTAASTLRNTLQKNSINELINKMIEEGLPLCESGRPDWIQGRWSNNQDGKKIYTPLHKILNEQGQTVIADDNHCFAFPKNEEEMEIYLNRIKTEEQQIEEQLVQKLYATLINAIPNYLEGSWNSFHQNIDQFIEKYFSWLALKLKRFLGSILNWIGRIFLDTIQFLLSPVTQWVQKELMNLSKSIPKVWSHPLHENALYIITDIFRNAVFPIA